MRYKLKPGPEWWPWFAWYPIVINSSYVWLEWVERTIIGEAVVHRFPRPSSEWR